MRTRLLAPFALALSHALAAPGSAGTLATPVFAAKDSEVISCTAANAGPKPVRGVLVELVSFENGPGSVIDTNGGPADLAPLAQTAAGASGGPGFDVYLCRITFQGSGKLLRAGATVSDLSFNILGTQHAY